MLFPTNINFTHNVFYDTSHLSKDDKVLLLEDAIKKSTHFHVDKLDMNLAYHRTTIKNANIFGYLDIIFEHKNHFVFIVRNATNPELTHIEVGISTLNHNPEYFIFIYMDIKELDYFLSKYNIMKKL